jgi:hypothetical protein
MIGLWNELLRRNQVLAWAGLANLVLFAVLAGVAFFNSTQIFGINRWIKPMKFAISIAVYHWTLAWLLSYLKGRETQIRWIAWGTVIVMFCEIILILVQAARGTHSHFNISTPLNAMIFSLMGILIAASSLLAGYVTALYFTSPIDLSPAYLMGIRLGLLLFLLGSLEGGYMASTRGHSVGVPDGGPGLALTNWSTTGGDLRIAHALGLHALQALPIAGAFFDWFGKQPALLTVAFAGLYFLVMTGLFIQAVSGHPLIAVK